jgi:ABC-type antimicrobial peptide transport system permease subunit
MVTPAIALIMVGVGVVAAYGPARRSLRIQPTEAVKSD